MRLAILGAPGTGKTWLAKALRQTSPHTLRVDDAPLLLQAVQRELLSGDLSLFPQALQQHRVYALHLLMGLDLVPHKGTTAPVDAAFAARMDSRLRELLHAQGIRYAMVYGTGDMRLASAMLAVQSAQQARTATRETSDWCWNCETCSDAACEHRIFSSLMERR